MKTLLAVIGLVLTLAVVVVAGVFIASESGEVIVLRTYDDAGQAHATRIWVVDDGGVSWIRAGIRRNAWYGRLSAHPEVEVERGGEVRRYRAVPVDDPEARARIHALMAAKYGLADRFIGLLRSASGSVAVRLDAR